MVDRSNGDAEQKQQNVGKLDKMGISEDLYEGASSFNIGGTNAAAAEILRTQCVPTPLTISLSSVCTPQEQILLSASDASPWSRKACYSRCRPVPGQHQTFHFH